MTIIYLKNNDKITKVIVVSFDKGNFIIYNDLLAKIKI
jgi:hypothetical protein